VAEKAGEASGGEEDGWHRMGRPISASSEMDRIRMGQSDSETVGFGIGVLFFLTDLIKY